MKNEAPLEKTVTGLLNKILSHAESRPNSIALSYLDHSNSQTDLTYQALNDEVNRLSSFISSRAEIGETVCLVYPHGLDFVIAFLACLRSGVIAVPCSVPKKGSHRSAARLAAIIDDAASKLVLTCSTLNTPSYLDGAAAIDIVSTDDLDLSEQKITPLRENEVAFIQYTSGSTGSPKGVVVTNANLVANELAIQDAFQHTPESLVVSWLPMYHDMGLIGGLLQPLFVGFRAVLMSPATFLANPIRWFEAIDKFRATTTGAPNFAFDLCANQLDDQAISKLDLSCLRVVFNGSEPVRAATLDRFATKFQSAQFRPESFFPCYGMSETTLLISGGPPNRVVPRASVQQLDQQTVVGCGKPAAGMSVVVVDPDTFLDVPTGEIGEIWVHGTSVAAGYWKNDQATTATFEARVQGDHSGRSFLRTGDLGFVDSTDEVYICGRIKDIIIVGGRNVYPQDIEATVEAALQLDPKFRTIAVRSDDPLRERVTLAVECNSELRKLARAGATNEASAIENHAKQLRAAIAETFDVSVDQIAFLKTGSLPKTTSGKVKRGALRAMLNGSEESPLYVSHSPHEAEGCEDVHEYVKTLLAETLADENSENSELSLDQLGLDSLGKQSLVAEIERHYHIRFDEAEVSGSRTIGDIAHLVKYNQNGKPKSSVDSKMTSLTDFAQRESRDLLLKTSEFRLWLSDAESRGFKRYLLPVIEQRGGRALVGGDNYSGEREVILFGSADYLGLAHDQRVKQAAADAILEHGCNVASVPLMAGSTPMHTVLEGQLAELLGHEACVLFPTGHSANMATIAAMCSQQDTVVVDNRVHYSILEGVRLAHAPWRTFLHNSPDSLRTILQSVRKTNRTRGILVVIEGVYGIEGDLADIDGLIAVAREFDARVMMDDAHSIGVLGNRGQGTPGHQNAIHKADIVMGSLSKSLGSFGGFIVSSQDVVDYLRFYAKAISFAVGMPVVNCAAALKSLEIMRTEPQRISEIQQKATFFRNALVAEGFAETAISQSTIMSSTVGSEELLRDVIKELFEQGVWAEGLPFPAVSRGQERVRFRVRSEHTLEDLTEAAKITGETCRRIIPRRLSVPGADVAGSDSVVSQLSHQQATEICNLAIRQAERLDTSLPWVSREFIVKYLMRAEYWAEASGEHTWHLSYTDGKITSAFSLDKAVTYIDGETTTTALLGAFTVEGGHEATLMERLSAVVSDVSDECEFVVAPASHPVQVFGSGVQSWREAGGKPFLESSLPEALAGALQQLGLQSAGEKTYYRVAIESKEPTPLPSGLVIRDFRRASYLEELEIVSPIIDQTLGKQDLCAPISPGILRGLIQDLRELVLPGFWLMAEMNGKPAGFAFCYPNITAEFRRIAGDADVADYQLIQQSMETADEAFLAWMGVTPEFAELGIAEGLIDELQKRLHHRGYKRLWMSWELIDGETPIIDLAKRVGDIEVTAQMPFFATRNREQIPVNGPHFNIAQRSVS